MSSWLCPTELQAHPIPNPSIPQSSRSKLSPGTVPCHGLNLSFSCSQGQGATSPVIYFFLYLEFSAPSRLSGQADTSSSVPWARCNSPAREMCSHLRGDAGRWGKSTQLQQNYTSCSSSTENQLNAIICHWRKLFAIDVKASPLGACSSCSTNLLKHLQESDRFKMLHPFCNFHFKHSVSIPCTQSCGTQNNID